MKKVATILILIFILSCSSGSQNLEIENIDLMNKLDTLEMQNQDLQEKIQTLEADYLTLQADYRLLQMTINNFRKQYESSDIERSIKNKE